MVKFSDIFKKDEPKKAESKIPPPETPALGPQPVPETKSPPHPVVFKEKPAKEEQREWPSDKGVTISEMVRAKNKLFNQEECLKLYQETARSVKELYDKVHADKQIVESDLVNMTAFVEQIVDQQFLDNNNILNLITLPGQNDYVYHYSVDDYAYHHAINVTIISIDVGLGLGYDKPELVKLGTVAILHDIGMPKFRDLCNLPRKFTQKEREEIKNHAKVGTELLEKFNDIYKRAATVIYQSHERVDGSGYPLGLKEGAIDEYAHIIGLADMYEALTHSRPYRRENSPFEALRIMLEHKNRFSKRIMKILLERLASPFPPGSNIKLSSGEKGRVIKRNLAHPLRPVVEIMHDNNGERLEQSRIIDLAQCPTVHIKSVLDKED